MDQQTQMYSLVQEWKESGLTKGKFISQKSVSYHRFNYWLKKYNKHHSSDTDNAALTFFSVGGSKVPSDKKSNPKKEPPKTLCIELPGGIKISIY
ncbi:MAG TPA: hypothetical protein VFD29_04230 [Gillisia sp.]|nr:hypothetical protein [Gillisia sp.]